MAEANIRAGICGYTTKVTAKADEEQEVSLEITRNAPI
jgi:ribosomal protein S17E